MGVNNNISEEVWAAKDRMSAYQSALKAASTNNQGLGKVPTDIIKEANFYYNKLMEAKNNSVHNHFDEDLTKQDPPIPTPNSQELDVLMKLAKAYSSNCPDSYKVDFYLICKNVFDRFDKYPQNEKSIDKIINAINIKDVIVEEK